MGLLRVAVLELGAPTVRGLGLKSTTAHCGDARLTKSMAARHKGQYGFRVCSVPLSRVEDELPKLDDIQQPL